jgi:hypothetical protein
MKQARGEVRFSNSIALPNSPSSPGTEEEGENGKLPFGDSERNCGDASMNSREFTFLAAGLPAIAAKQIRHCVLFPDVFPDPAENSIPPKA